MNIKNKLFAIGLSVTTAVWLSGGLMLLPAQTVQAATVEELSAQIAQLLVQIQQLQAQLNAVQGQTPSTYNFTKNLTIGSRGADVTALQQFLKDQGAAIYPEGLVTGYFGSLTKAALGKYQAKVGISPTAGYFGPITRAQINSLTVITGCTTNADCAASQFCQAGVCVTTPIGTGLTASLAYDTPAAATIPGGAQGVEFLKFNISGSGTIDSIIIKRVGPGATADFTSAGVYLFDGSTRLTSGRSLNSTTHEITFTGLSLAISGTKTLTLVANIAAALTSTAGNQNAFEVTSASSISGSATISGTFPIRGNYMNIAGSVVGGLTITSSTLPSNPKVGDLGAKIATFKLDANSTEDINVRRVTLYYTGAVSQSNLSNFVLKQAGNTVATASAITSRGLLVLDFTTPFSLEKGTNRIFELYADIAAGSRAGSTETIKFYIEDSGDVYAVGKTYGYGVTLTNTFDSTNSQTVTLDTGQITIGFNGPSASDIAVRGQDVTLFRFSIKSANRTEFRKLSFTVATTLLGTGEGFNDLKIVDEGTGAVLTSAVDITISTTATDFTDIFEIAAGQTRNFKVTADVDADDDTSDTITVTLNAFGTTDIKNLDNNTFVVPSTDVVPNSAIAGNTMTVKTASASVTLAGDPTSKTVTAGTTNVDLLGFNIQATADDLKITQIVVTASSTAGATGISNSQIQAALGTVRLFDGSTQIGTNKSFNSSLVATFDNLSYVVSKGNTKLIKVRIDGFSTSASSTGYYAHLAASAFTAQDSGNNTVTISDIVNTAGTVLITVGTPSLTIARVGTGSEDTDAGIVVAGGTRVLGRFSIKATNGDINVTKLQFGVADAALNATSSGLTDEAAGIYLKQCSTIDCSSKTTILGSTDGLSLIATGEAAGTVKAANDSGLFTINRGQTNYYTIETRLNNVIQGSTEGADAGTSLFASILETNFEARSGNTTKTSFTTSTGGTALGVTGNQKFVVRSALTLSVTPPSAPEDNVLISGLNKVIDFTVGADGTDIALKAFGINITATGATVSTPTNANVTVTDITGGGSTSITVGSVSGSVITGGNSGDLYIVLTTPPTITAGSPKTYRVKVTAANVSTVDNAATLSTVLDRNLTTQISLTTTNSADLLTAFGNYKATSTYDVAVWVWSDLSQDGAATESQSQWTNNGLTRPFPSANWVIKN